MAASDLAQVIEQYHQTVQAFVEHGDLEPQKRLWSHRDDVTLANPLGPPARGWDHVETTLQHAAAQLRGRDAQVLNVEPIAAYATAELAYIVEIERAWMRLGEAGEPRSVALRVTTIFRREDGAWRVVHRHADPITTPRPLESIG